MCLCFCDPQNSSTLGEFIKKKKKKNISYVDRLDVQTKYIFGVGGLQPSVWAADLFRIGEPPEGVKKKKKKKLQMHQS